MTNETFKRYLVSSLTTFLSTFFAIVGLQISLGAIDFANLTSATLVSVLMVAGRAGVKAVVEKYTIVSGDKVA